MPERKLLKIVVFFSFNFYSFFTLSTHIVSHLYIFQKYHFHPFFVFFFTTSSPLHRQHNLWFGFWVQFALVLETQKEVVVGSGKHLDLWREIGGTNVLLAIVFVTSASGHTSIHPWFVLKQTLFTEPEFSTMFFGIKKEAKQTDQIHTRCGNWFDWKLLFFSFSGPSNFCYLIMILYIHYFSKNVYVHLVYTKHTFDIWCGG